MEFSLPLPRNVSQRQALGSSSVAKRKQISKHIPTSIPAPFPPHLLGLLFPVPPPPIKESNKKSLWSRQAMSSHSFRRLSSLLNNTRLLPCLPHPRGAVVLESSSWFQMVLRQNSLALSWSEMVLGQLPGSSRLLEEKGDLLPIAQAQDSQELCCLPGNEGQGTLLHCKHPQGKKGQGPARS